MAETHQADMAGQLAQWRGRGGEAAQEEPRGPAQVIQLPLWPEPKRGTPNAVLRGALFAAIHKDRQYMRRKGADSSPGRYHYPVYRGAARPDRPGRMGAGPAPRPATGARHPVPVHGERLSQGAWPSVRQERSRMAEVCLCSADGHGGRDL